MTCGEGMKRREIVCFDEVAHKITSRHYCSHLEKPNTESGCRDRTCASWRVGEWSSCSATCGQVYILQCPNVPPVPATLSPTRRYNYMCLLLWTICYCTIINCLKEMTLKYQNVFSMLHFAIIVISLSLLV